MSRQPLAWQTCFQAQTRVNQHRDIGPTEIRRSEQFVKATTDAVESFANPFGVDDVDHLYNIASGSPTSVAVETDILRTEIAGKEAKERFIQDRLQKGEKFFDPVKRLDLKTMADMNKTVQLKTSKDKVVEFKQQDNVALLLLVKTQEQGSQIDLDM